jgi:hypothetical protein
MAYMTAMFESLHKGLKKSKKSSKKRKKCFDDSSSDSNSEYEIGSGDMEFSVDKHLKLEKSTGYNYMSSETPPIKVTNVDPETIRANEIAIENSKTGKITAVVRVMYLFRETKRKSRTTNPELEKRKKTLFQETDMKVSILLDNSRNLRRMSQKSRNKPFLSKMAPKSKSSGTVSNKLAKNHQKLSIRDNLAISRNKVSPTRTTESYVDISTS